MLTYLLCSYVVSVGDCTIRCIVKEEIVCHPNAWSMRPMFEQIQSMLKNT